MTFARSAMRRFLRGTGPLARGSDRFQLTLRLLVLLALLAAGALGAWRGMSTHARLDTVAAEQARSRTAAHATVLGDTLGWPISGSGERVRTLVSWDAPGDRTRVAVAMVPDGSHTGDEVTVWMNRHGETTAAPMDPGTIAGKSVVNGLQTLAAVTLVPLGSYAAACWLLGRRRAREWAAEWAAVEPDWTRQAR